MPCPVERLIAWAVKGVSTKAVLDASGGIAAVGGREGEGLRVAQGIYINKHRWVWPRSFPKGHLSLAGGSSARCGLQRCCGVDGG